MTSGARGAGLQPGSRLVAAVIVSVLMSACSPLSEPADLVISNVVVYSGVDDAPFRANVSIRHGRFVAIDRDVSKLPDTIEFIDGDGLYMTPGLWDMHVHIANTETENIDVQRFPAFGVTSIRDAGGFTVTIHERIAEISAGQLTGPSVYYVGPTLNGESFAPFQQVVTTGDKVRTAVDNAIASGASMIKIHRAFRPELLAHLIELAHERGLKVTGHIPLGVAPLTACELGMDGIEHVASLIEASISVAPDGRRDSATAIAHLLSGETAELYDCLARRNVSVTPTLVVYPAVARSRLGGQPVTEEYQAFMDGAKAITLRLYGSGVTLLTGSDTAAGGPLDIAPGISLLEELDLLQEAGLPPYAIIQAATSNPAHTLGVDGESGSIRPGRIADFLLLESDPGTDVANFRHLRVAYRAGREIPD